ncbi:hypothetical protein AB7M47_005261 [Bradyrhizobium elkanii]|jgi:hypothetical protein|nr:hypothetical protein [Bradyrhizobium elkanii]MCS3558665.1 hypothetical protein [Bradyrhizobium elkanii]MCW2151488.1 hypothetical protein [Bradyrhizobium elkanii]MCW2358639.1 hypothetical protein [Bradyrhizobium elkanii]MCW2375219.1 hypothetical protein [Bradyrhizobium elkanii]
MKILTRYLLRAGLPRGASLAGDLSCASNSIERHGA